MVLQHDGAFTIAVGKSRHEKNWKNVEVTWSSLLTYKLQETHRTAETVTEYAASTKDRQAEIKDIGGFVGGYIPGGRRKQGNIMNRQLVTLDIDVITGDIWPLLTLLYPCAAAIYTTHKHTPSAPRYRLVMPLDRAVAPDEYIAISRRIAGNLDIENFDNVSFRPSQLMYWPSTPSNGEYIFKFQDAPFLSADAVLASYQDWKDTSQWPISVKAKEAIIHGIKKQGDPLEKPGVIGAWCRQYTVEEVISLFLSDQYAPTDLPDRYTYLQGSTAGGLIVYESKYAYSHHGTDPISGKLCNAFDLARLHKFGLMDEDSRADTGTTELPSYKLMIEFAAADGNTRQRLALERINEALSDFDGQPGQPAEVLRELNELNTDWMKKLKADKRGQFLSTINNIITILKNDPNLKERFAFNDFEKREIALKDMPWRRITTDTAALKDSDDSNIRYYLENVYKINGKDKINDALTIVVHENTFHPVKQYLTSLVWDGSPRIEKLFIEYMGAEDSAYLRAVTRKFLSAAVARIYTPGVKFDYCLTLVGEEGIQKSSFFDLLAKSWFSDSLHKIEGTQALEQLQGVWIIELAELSGIKNSDVEAVKHFIAKRTDRYRVAYGKRVENFPRQCIFVGTTNKRNFLKSMEGDRRFWPVETLINRPTKSAHKDLTELEINQIWAEAVQLFKAGEKLYLAPELEKIAKGIQAEHREKDEREGIIIEYLNTLVPEDWEKKLPYERRNFLQGDPLAKPGTVLRDKISVAEIWCECLGKQQSDMTTINTKPLHNILKNLDGWQEYNKTKLRFSYYGPQKAYVRIKEVCTVVPVLPVGFF